MADTPAISANSTAPKMGWVKTKEPDKRPPLPVIAEEAKGDFSAKNKDWPKDQFENVKQYALGNGNPTISKALAKLTPEQTQVYLDTAKEVFLSHCDTKNWRDGNPVRPPIVEIVDAATAKFKEKGWSTKPLDKVKKYVQKTGNPTISGHLGKLNPEQAKAYLSTVTRVFAASCGYEWKEIKEEKVEEAPASEPMMSVAAPETVTIGEVKPYWAEPGKEFQLTVTGTNLKQVASADGPAPFDNLGEPEISDDGKEMKFGAINVPADAAAGKYKIVLKDKDGHEVASLEVAVPELGEERFSDAVRKLNLKLDVNSGLVAGAKGYAGLGIYEEPITVSTFGARAALAPQIVGEDGYVKSAKHEVTVKAEGDLAYRLYKDDSRMMGALFGAGYQLHLSQFFAPEVYANVTVRNNNYKNPTPQYFSGTAWNENFGLAVNSQPAEWLAARAYFGLNIGQAAIDESYLGYPGFTSFNDSSRSLETGARVKLGKDALNGELHFDLKQGYHQAPDRANIGGVWYDFGPTYERFNIISAGAKLAVGDKLNAAYDYTAKRYGGWWDDIDIHRASVGTRLKGNDFGLNADLRPKSSFKSFGAAWQNRYVNLGAGAVSLNGNAGVYVGGGLNLYTISEKIWGTRQPVYTADKEFQPEPADPMPDVAEEEIKDPFPPAAEPATEPAPGADPNGIE